MLLIFGARQQVLPRFRRRILYNRLHARPPALVLLSLPDPVWSGLGSFAMSEQVVKPLAFHPGRGSGDLAARLWEDSARLVGLGPDPTPDP